MHSAHYLLLITSALFAMGAGAQFQSATQDFHRLDDTQTSQAIPWSNPAVGGPIKVLAIAPHSTMGDVARLRDHIEMELETVALWDRNNLGFDPRFPQPAFPDAERDAVLERLESVLQKKKIDLIILAQSDPAILPVSVQEAIIASVKKGTGLILANHGLRDVSILKTWLDSQAQPESAPDLFHGVGPLGVDRNLATSLLRLHESEEGGRIVQWTFEHAPTANHSLIPIPASPYNVRREYLDNAFSLLGRAVRWATHEEAPVRIAEIADISPQGPDDEEIPPGYPTEFVERVRKNALAQPLRPYAIQLDQPAKESMEVWYRLRNVGATAPDILRTAADSPLRKGAQFYPLDVIAAPGNYLLDVWLKNRKGTVTWHTQTIHVPGWPTLSDIRLTRDGAAATWVQPNDYVVVEAEVGHGVLSLQRQVGRAYARAVDSFGRQIASNDAIVGSEGGAVSLRLELADILAPLITIEVFAVPDFMVKESTITDQAAREVFYLPVRMAESQLNPALVVTTATRPDHGTYLQLETLREQFGLSALHAPLSIDALLASGRVGLSRLSQVVPESGGAGFTGLIREPCLSAPSHQADMKGAIESGMLQSYAGGPPVYSLGAGNALTHTDTELCQGPNCLDVFRARLRTQYGTLNALNGAWGSDFVAWEDVVPVSLEGCRERGRYLPWIDFRLSMNTVFAANLAAGRDQAHQIDPQARVGFQPAPHQPKPQSGLQWGPIAAAVDYMVVPNTAPSIRRLQSFQGVRPWSGVVVDSGELYGTPREAGWFAWHCALERVPAIWLDEPFTDELSRILGPTGIATPTFAAFGEARNEMADGLGTLLLRAEPYRNGIAFLDTPESDMFRSTLGESGTEEPMHSEDWFADTLNTLGYAPVVRVLETDSENSFEGINTLILADTRVLTTSQCAALTDFHKGDGLIIMSRLPNRLEALQSSEKSSALPFMHPVIQGDDVPELWSNRPVWSRELDASASLSDQLEALLAKAGNRPMPEVNIADKHRDQLRRYYYSYGGALIHAFLPVQSVDATLRRASISIEDGSYGYDLRAIETLPIKSRFQWSPSPGEPAIVSILPYRVEEVYLTVSADAPAGERLPVDIQVLVRDGKPGLHLIGLQVMGPNGNAISYYGQVLEAPEGHVKTFLPLSQNEGPVRYKVVATDLLTSISAETYVTVL